MNGIFLSSLERQSETTYQQQLEAKFPSHTFKQKQRHYATPIPEIKLYSY